MTAQEGDLDICVLSPRQFNPELFHSLTEATRRPVKVTIADYEEGFELRTLKSRRLPAQELQSRSPQITPDLRAALRRAEVVQALDTPLGLLDLAPRLRWIQAIGAGVWHLYPLELKEAGVLMTNGRGIASLPIAEFVIARFLEVWKNLAALRAAQAEHRWNPIAARTVAGATLGIVGLGSIGTEVARLGHALGMDVVAIRRRPDASPPNATVRAIWGPERLGDLLAASDLAVIAVPENDSTRQLIRQEHLSMMKPHSVLCNVGRGSALDEQALEQALRDGRPGAAVLDVTEDEPLLPGSPLWDVPNLYLSPHCAAMHSDYADRFTRLFADNVLRYIQGRPLNNIVDQALGY